MMVARVGLDRHIDDMKAGDRLTVFKAGKDDFYTVTVEASESAREGRQTHPPQGGEVEEGLHTEGAEAGLEALLNGVTEENRHDEF